MSLSFSVKEAIGKKPDVKVTPFEPITLDLLQDTDYQSGSKLWHQSLAFKDMILQQMNILYGIWIFLHSADVLREIYTVP